MITPTESPCDLGRLLVLFLALRGAFVKDYAAAHSQNNFSFKPEMRDLFLFGGVHQGAREFLVRVIPTQKLHENIQNDTKPTTQGWCGTAFEFIGKRMQAPEQFFNPRDGRQVIETVANGDSFAVEF